jgi:hypothetical protein
MIGVTAGGFGPTRTEANRDPKLMLAVGLALTVVTGCLPQ